MAFTTDKSNLARSIPDFTQMKLDGKPLPAELSQALRRAFTITYDLRDFLSFLWIDRETPQGSGVAYTLLFVPMPPESLRLYKNGVLMRFGVDYLLTGASITLAASPVGTDWFQAYYRRVGNSPVQDANIQHAMNASPIPPPFINPSVGDTGSGVGGQGNEHYLGGHRPEIIIITAGFGICY